MASEGEPLPGIPAAPRTSFRIGYPLCASHRSGFIDGLDSPPVRHRVRSVDHDDGDPKLACGNQLRVGGSAAAVLAHQQLDAMREKKLSFPVGRERPAARPPDRILRAARAFAARPPVEPETWSCAGERRPGGPSHPSTGIRGHRPKPVHARLPRRQRPRTPPGSTDLRRRVTRRASRAEPAGCAVRRTPVPRAARWFQRRDESRRRPQSPLRLRGSGTVPSAPPNPPERTRPGIAAGCRVRPASDVTTSNSTRCSSARARPSASPVPPRMRTLRLKTLPTCPPGHPADRTR